MPKSFLTAQVLLKICFYSSDIVDSTENGNAYNELIITELQLKRDSCGSQKHAASRMEKQEWKGGTQPQHAITLIYKLL